MNNRSYATDQRTDNRSSNDDLKRSINTLPTSDPKNPAPNPFIVGRKLYQPATNGSKPVSDK
jgi:hypothetical protein